ncbi:MAG TPA: bifunctional (p)ppGpp synthetase/guanosine-3',5'-bis(diphosphate) 3'-pyrophosphohydrolase [Phycisphaerales bacterium]|nr:bifunctional (p)ppGpp synthetase/guanosine-3',5'-bis(diphosphate) 3'-pyrophosphohydrolase [Phycisphaerales bacterium]
MGAEREDTRDSLKELVESLQTYLSDEALATVEKAFRLAQERHRPQVRASGEPYILHPIEVATILAQYKLDPPTIAASLLHDTVEDTNTNLEELQELFGKEVRLLVDGVTKLTAISSRQGREAPTPRSKQMAAAENLRKIFLAMTKDLRVILIKLADRLHNLRTLGNLRPDKQKRIAGETLEIFAPIASRLGVFEMKRELEDLCFKYLYPEEYEELLSSVDSLQEIREASLAQAVEKIQEKLDKLNIEATMEWREKHLYSTFRKMERTGRTLEEIYDLVALRVVVPRVEDCYSVLGAIHSIWIPMKDRIKDYIAVPKSNNYRSLHTTIFGPNRLPLEIQIRTDEMHQVNEMGIAAHWAYKEGSGKAKASKESKLFKEIYPWIRAILDWQDDSRDAKEYIENLKVDLLQNEVFVFTPQGDVVDLPAGSCPLDFAYRIHTEVGHRCIGAKVNSKMVPLTTVLQNADIVEIVTSKTSNPSLDWLRICKSNGARNKIRAWFKKEKREENITRGRDMLRRELGRQRMDKLASDDPLLQKVANRLNFVEIDDLMASLGYNETSLPQVLARLREELPKEVSESILPTPRSTSVRPSSGRAVEVVGLDNILVKFARCCAPVPGDPIRGYITLGKGVSVHVDGCTNLNALLESSPEREIEVRWDQPESATGYQVEVEIEAWDRAGLLSDVMGVINENKISTRACKAWTRKDTAYVRMSLDIANKRQLEELMKRLRRVRDVTMVRRTSQRAR